MKQKLNSSKVLLVRWRGEKVTKRRKKLSKAACQRWWKVKQREGVIYLL